MARRSILNLGVPDYAGQILQLAQRLATVELRNSQLVSAQAQYDARLAALEAGGTPTPTPTPAPVFTQQPTISPTSGTAGTTTFTATPGVVTGGSVTSRTWLLNGTSISTSLTATPQAAGTLTYQEGAIGAGGTAQSSVISATVAVDNGGGTPTPTPAPTGDAGFSLERTPGSSITAYPPQVDLVQRYVFNSGDVLHSRYSTDSTFATAVTNLPDYTFTDAAITAGQYPNPFKVITSQPSGGVPYMQARINDGPWTAPLMHGDAVAPTLTSSLAVNGFQGIAGSTVVTANKPFTLRQEGGAQADDFYFDGTTVRWYALPDAGAHRLRFRLVSLAGVAGDVQEMVMTAAANTPNAFTFTPVSNATRSQSYTSNTITIAGLQNGSSVPYSVSGAGQVSKNGGAFSTAGGTATNSDTFAVREDSSANYATGVNTTLAVGDKSATYTVTTGVEPSAVSSVFDNKSANIGNTDNYIFSAVSLPAGSILIAAYNGTGAQNGLTFGSTAATLLGFVRQNDGADNGGHYYLYRLNLAQAATADLKFTYPYMYDGTVPLEVQAVAVAGSPGSPLGISKLKEVFSGNPHTFDSAIGQSGANTTVIFVRDGTDNPGNFAWGSGITAVSNAQSTVQSGNFLRVGRATTALTPSFTAGDGYPSGIAVAFGA